MNDSTKVCHQTLTSGALLKIAYLFIVKHESTFHLVFWPCSIVRAHRMTEIV